MPNLENSSNINLQPQPRSQKVWEKLQTQNSADRQKSLEQINKLTRQDLLKLKTHIQWANFELPTDFSTEKIKNYLDQKIPKANEYLKSQINEFQKETNPQKKQNILNMRILWKFSNWNLNNAHFLTNFLELNNILTTIESKTGKTDFKDSINRLKFFVDLANYETLDINNWDKIQTLLNKILNENSSIDSNSSWQQTDDQSDNTDQNNETQKFQWFEMSVQDYENLKKLDIDLKYIWDKQIWFMLIWEKKYNLVSQKNETFPLLPEYRPDSSDENDLTKIFSSENYSKIVLNWTKVIFTKKDWQKEEWKLVQDSTNTLPSTPTTPSVEKIDDINKINEQLWTKWISFKPTDEIDFFDNPIWLRLDYWNKNDLEFNISDSQWNSISNVRSDFDNDWKNPIVWLPKNATDINFDTKTDIQSSWYFQLNIHYKLDWKDYTFSISPNAEYLTDSTTQDNFQTTEILQLDSKINEYLESIWLDSRIFWDKKIIIPENFQANLDWEIKNSWEEISTGWYEILPSFSDDEWNLVDWIILSDWNWNNKKLILEKISSDPGQDLTELPTSVDTRPSLEWTLSTD